MNVLASLLGSLSCDLLCSRSLRALLVANEAGGAGFAGIAKLNAGMGVGLASGVGCELLAGYWAFWACGWDGWAGSGNKFSGSLGLGVNIFDKLKNNCTRKNYLTI